MCLFISHSRPSGIMWAVDRDRADKHWAKAQARLRSPVRVAAYLLVITVGVLSVAWQAFTSEGWTSIGLLVLLGLMVMTYIKLIVVGASVRKQEQPPEWWYRGGLAGRLKARREHQ